MKLRVWEDGYGMRHDPHPINDWPARCAEWMKSMGFLDGK